MNLKESFRYQKFLNKLGNEAYISLIDRDHCFKVTKNHMINKANPEDKDFVEEVEPSVEFYKNDDVLSFVQWLIAEKDKLSHAIGEAKAGLKFDIDAAIETNKLRRQCSEAIKNMLKISPDEKTEVGKSYKFNAEGNQVVYYYDIEVVSKDAFDRKEAKAAMKEMISNADKFSNAIDIALMETEVKYDPIFNVNDSFEEVMEEFINK